MKLAYVRCDGKYIKRQDMWGGKYTQNIYYANHSNIKEAHQDVAYFL